MLDIDSNTFNLEIFSDNYLIPEFIVIIPAGFRPKGGLKRINFILEITAQCLFPRFSTQKLGPRNTFLKSLGFYF